MFIGVMMESIFEWVAWPKDETRRKKLKRTFGLVLILGLALELPETARLRKLAADAHKEAAEVNLKAVALEADNLVLRSNVVSLEMKLGWRHLAQHQTEIIEQYLANTPKGKVQFEWYTSDPECVSYKSELAKEFKKLGYAVEDGDSFPMAYPPVPGLEIWVGSKTQPPPEAAPIQRAFESAGIHLPGAVDDRAVDAVIIKVGIKPNRDL